MALQKQNVNLNFTGMDAGVDERLLSPGRMTRLDNGYFSDGGTLKRRGGYRISQQTQGLDEEAFGSLKRLDKYQNQLLMEDAGSGVYSRSKVDSGISVHQLDWLRSNGYSIQRSSMRASLETDFVARCDDNKLSIPISFDCAYSGNLSGFSFWVWEVESTGTGYTLVHEIHYLVRNEKTKQTVLSGSFEGLVTDMNPRVLWVDSAGKFYLYYGDSGPNITLRELPLSTLQFNSPVTAVAGGTSVFDAYYHVAQDKLLFTYKETGSNDLVMNSVDPQDGVAVIQTGTVVATTVSSLSAIVLFDGTDNQYVVAWNDGTNNVKLSAAMFDAGPTISTVNQAVGHSVGRIVTCWGHTQGVDVSYEQKPGNPNAHIEGLRFDPTTGTIVSGPFDVCGGMNIAARPQRMLGMARTLLPVTMPGPNGPQANQGGVFVVDLHDLEQAGAPNVADVLVQSGVQPGVYARILPEETGIPTSTVRVPSAFPLFDEPITPANSLVASFPILARKEPEFIGAGPGAVWDYYIVSATLDFKAQLSVLDLAPGAYLPGACPMFYDGANLVEAEFHTFPIISSVAPSAAGSGLVAGQTYSFILVYAWRDACGRIHRSAPSIAESITLGGGDNSAEVHFYDQLLTRRDGVQLELYRTKQGGTIYYRELTPVASNGQLLTLSLGDNFLGEALYTTGAVLDNAASQSYGQGCLHQGRVFQIDPDRQTINYSDADVKDQCPNFSEVYRLRVPGDHGKLVAIHSMDDRLIAICTNGIYSFSGTGPNLLGAQNGYSEAFLLEAAIGACDGQGNSLARDPEGLWFMSPKGPRHFSRGLQITRLQDNRFLGSEVDGKILNALGQPNCIKAFNVPGTTQVRFWDGLLQWVWDYRFRQWSRFTNFVAADATVGLDGTVYHGKAGASRGESLHEENQLLTVDTLTSRYQLLAETPWIHFAGVQGYQRVYRFFFLADLDDEDSPIDPTLYSQPFNLAVYTDYDKSAPAEQATILFDDAAEGARKPIQYEHHFAHQKNQAIKLIINDAPVNGFQVNYKLTNFMLQVGIKRGGPKLPQTKKI